MDADRIERVLRAGPPDEPVYVPGSFDRRATRGPWWFAVAALAVVIALVTGLAIGTALDVQRGGEVGGDPAPRPLVAADLQGVWESDPIERRDLEGALLADGFSRADVAAFLDHEPSEDHVRFALRFIDDRLTVQAAYDDQPFQTLDIARFVMRDGGFAIVADGLVNACEPVAAASIDGSRLSLSVVELPNCNVDDRIANTLFLQIATYTRVDN